MHNLQQLLVDPPGGALDIVDGLEDIRKVSLSEPLLRIIALARKLPAAMICALVGVFAVFHGYAHVVEMNAGHSLVSYAAGFIAATAMLHAIGIAIGITIRNTLTFGRLAGRESRFVAHCFS